MEPDFDIEKITANVVREVTPLMKSGNAVPADPDFISDAIAQVTAPLLDAVESLSARLDRLN